MIDEDQLRALLAEAADSAPAPGRAPQELLDAVVVQRDAAPRTRPRTRTVLAAAAAVVVVAVVGLTLVSEPAARDTAASGGDDAEATDGATSPDDLAYDGDGAATGGTASGAGGTGGASGEGELGPVAAPAAPATPVVAGPPTDTARVIRTGSLDLEVPEGAFQATVDRITAQTVGLGGYIAEATTSESDESPSGSITVRVPGDSFDQLLSDLRELGEVQAVTAKGVDVTAQFTDLEARLSALTATRDRLDAVLAEAANVGDILAVQDRITAIQVQIEQVQGQQKLLEDQTAFATLAVTLGEPGADIIEVERAGDGGLGGAWDEARRRFGDNVETVVSWSGSAAVVLVVAVVALLVGRAVWVGTRRRFV